MRYGPLQKPYRKDLSGMIFGSVIAVDYVGKNKDGDLMWLCRCNFVKNGMACGKYFEVRATSLVAGKTQSCGCSSITHGLTRGGKPPAYKSWIAVKDRCFNKESTAWPDYGGRGITMCKGWDESFESFDRDLGRRPPLTSIERIDNNGHYSCGHCPECVEKHWPMNCRWATAKDQARNRRSTVMITHDGKTQSLAAWAEQYGIDLRKLWDRLYRYKMPVAKALSLNSKNC